MTTILVVLQVILSISIIIVVLLQKSSSIGLGAYSGSNESLFGARGPASFMTKVTLGLGFIFLVNTIALGYLYNTKSARNKSITDSVEIPKSIPLAPSDNAIPLSNPLLNNTQQQQQLLPTMQAPENGVFPNIESNHTESTPQSQTSEGQK